MNLYPRIQTEPLFIRNEFEKACVRTDHVEHKVFLKLDGDLEKPEDPGNSKMIDQIMLEGKEITEKEYNNY